jgi:hypothetical protein
MKNIKKSEEEIIMDKIFKQSEVVVVGGGTAGVVAAIAAARNKADTILIERYGSLGGMSTGGMINFYNSFHNLKGDQVIGGIAWEIVERLTKLGGTPGALPDYTGLTGSLTIFNQKLLELLLFKMLEQSGAKLLLHSYLSDVTVDNGAIKETVFVNKSGKTIVTGAVFIDSTGDADLAYLAGTPCEKTDKAVTQPVTLEFRVAGVDAEQVKDYIYNHPEQFELEVAPQEIYNQKYLVHWCAFIPSLIAYDEAGKLTGGLTHKQIWFNTHEPEAGRGIITFNATRVANIDGTNVEDLTYAEVEARKQIPILINFFRENIPGFENAYLIDFASQLGVRETRRIVGEYQLTKEDVREGHRHADVIAKAVSQIDIHGSNQDEKKFFWIKQPKTQTYFDYDIPYRALLPQNINNLIVACRAISATREAHGSVRFMPPCMAIGEAAGVAAALSVREKVSPKEVDVQVLQKALCAQGVILN